MQVNLLKKIISLFKNTLLYYKFGLIIALVLYLSSLFLAIFIFNNEKLKINLHSIGFFELLSHNLISASLIIIFGLISFGLLGNFILIANGAILGYIVSGVYNSYGFYPILLHVGPHFIFEISALLVSTAISYETGKFIYNVKHDTKKVIRIKFLCTGLIIILCLLIISALIESQVGI